MFSKRPICFLFVILNLVLQTSNAARAPKLDLDCSDLSPDIVTEIRSYSWLVTAVSDLVLDGALKGSTYDNLGTFVDKFGSRLTGSQNLEDAIDHIVDLLTTSELENVHTENVTIAVWVRGNESLSLVEPRNQQMALLGLGSTVGTPPEGITAEVLVVNNFDELPLKADVIPGKIVAYNEPWISYGDSVEYRATGASKAARYGAVATLVRSATGYSIYSPHTGDNSYDEGIPKIPTACITVEDAEMLQRMQDRGDKIVVKLTMDDQNLGDGISRNTVAETKGSTDPEEVVIISGHIDSWDVGQGAMDDGGGVFISIMAQIVLKHLDLRPRRTLRTVLWTAEEYHLKGADAYVIEHVNEFDNYNIVLESDEGTFDPDGLAFTGVLEAACMIKEIMNLTEFLNATNLYMPDDGSDETVFTPYGIPTGSLSVLGDYFNYHHSNGDTMTVQDPDSMDKCLVFWTVLSYVLADLSIPLPRPNINVEKN